MLFSSIGPTKAVAVWTVPLLVILSLCLSLNFTLAHKPLAPFRFTTGLLDAENFYKNPQNSGPAGLGIGTLKPNLKAPPSTALYFDQLLDHFSPFSSSRFRQVYFVNDKFIKAPAPPRFVHFILPQEVGYSYDPTLSDSLASRWGALSVTIEHRFYGNSIPSGDLSDLNYLAFFTVEQAMEDFIAFRAHIQNIYNLTEHTPWLLDGCSYSGAMSAWMKAAYPNLFFGSIAGSSVIEARLDFDEYVRVMGQQIPSDCNSYLIEARNQIESFILTKSGRDLITNSFSVCTSQDPGDEDPLNEPTNKFLFDAFLFNQVSSVVQYGSASAIASMCKGIMSNSTSQLSGFGSYITKNALNPPDQPCLFVNYKKAIPFIKTQLLDDTAFGWQQCTQLGYMQTTEGDDSVLPRYFNLTGYLRFCEDVFSDPIRYPQIILNFTQPDSIEDDRSLPRVNTFNFVHGSHDIQLTNTLFINGGIDPYHVLSNYLESQLVGLSALPSSLNGVLFYEGYSHCSYGPNVTDIKDQYIQKWLDTW